MNSKLSLLMISKDADDLLEKSLKSSKGLVDEIIIIDDFSSDNTLEIAKKFNAKIYLHHERDFGKQKAYGLEKVSGDWVIALDSDEVISAKLKNEIKHLKTLNYTGFYIPFQTHFLSRPLYFGGENYKKLILFKKDSTKIDLALVHEEFKISKGMVGELKNKINHYSYRSLWQMYKKFTDYAIREAKQKLKIGEKTSFSKIFLYPLHMFWARFVEDKGYKDGLFRIPLDLGFAYMEFLTYLLMLLFRSGNNADSNAD